VRRGDLFWFEPDPVRGSEQAGRRPGVILSHDAINRASPVIIVVPVTTYHDQRLYPSDVLIRAPEGGLSRDSVAMALHLRSVDKQRVSTYIGHVNEGTLAQVEQAILQVMDIRLSRRR
jgi:mRNA interferase MazF